MTEHTLDEIFNTFIRELLRIDLVIKTKVISRNYFLYIQTTRTKPQLDDNLLLAAGIAMRGKIVTAKIDYVRMTNHGEHVYSTRFLVPLRKRFCCGNGCKDCIRLHN